jgi:hypothetical protein
MDEVVRLRDVLERLLKFLDQGNSEQTNLPTFKLLTDPDGPLSSSGPNRQARPLGLPVGLSGHSLYLK